jgi:hypothetical protein
MHAAPSTSHQISAVGKSSWSPERIPGLVMHAFCLTSSCDWFDSAFAGPVDLQGFPQGYCIQKASGEPSDFLDAHFDSKPTKLISS